MTVVEAAARVKARNLSSRALLLVNLALNTTGANGTHTVDLDAEEDVFSARERRLDALACLIVAIETVKTTPIRKAVSKPKPVGPN